MSHARVSGPSTAGLTCRRCAGVDTRHVHAPPASEGADAVGRIRWVTEDDLEQVLEKDVFQAMRCYVKPEQRRDFEEYYKYNVEDSALPQS